MLVLHRRINKSIIIRDKETGAKMKITLLEIRGNGARIGLDAGSRFEIFREEILPKELNNQDPSASTEREEIPIQAT